jgi:hypothetical protein
VRELLRFPDPVNETSARLVAAFVVAEAVVFLVTRDAWVLVPLTYGFLARVATGPTLSPVGQFVTRIATPEVEGWIRRRNPDFRSRQVPGRPKRFAQAIGLAFTASASIAWLLDAPTAAFVLVGLLAVAATLEAAFAVCLGCIAYSAIWGCADCDDISERLRQALIEARQETTDRGTPVTPPITLPATPSVTPSVTPSAAVARAEPMNSVDASPAMR